MERNGITEPHKKLKCRIIDIMTLENYQVPEEEIPESYEKYGDLVLFRDRFFKSPIWYESDGVAWKTICECLKVNRVGLKGSVVDDDFRSPQVKIVYGPSGWVEMKDNGIIYSWDCERSMFCRGNLSERHRIAKLNCQGKVIVDLFAGIGYFTLPYLVHAGAAHVHACEWNPYAVKALRRNLMLNSVSDKCTIHEGDNRNAGLKLLGDIINVGIIPSSTEFWKTACTALKKSGGILYIHENVASDVNTQKEKCSKCTALMGEKNINHDLFSVYSIKGTLTTWEVQRELNQKLEWKHIEWVEFSFHITHCIFTFLVFIHPTIHWTVCVQQYFRVKSYAPHIDHLVYAVHCSPDLSVC